MHLVADISSHGYGHLAQTAPVLNRLAERLPQLRITVRSLLPQRVVALRLHCPYALEARGMDVGMPMHDATRVDLAAARDAYAAFHVHWPARVAGEARALESLGPDLLLANVPYLSLGAAQQAGVPAVAMCSLNWLDLYRELCADGHGDAARILGEMEAAHAAARAFLAPRPSMPMPALEAAIGKVSPIGPVAQPGRRRREELARRLGIPADRPLVLVSMGGVRYGLRCSGWPGSRDLFFVVPDRLDAPRRDMAGLDETGLPFPDLLASADAVLTKPGYGSFVEAACGGLAVAYLRRERWPEEAALLDWLRDHARCMEVGEAALHRGDFHAGLRRCLAAAPPPPVLPAGVEEAATRLAAMLSA
jgi:hypothetical protein